MRTFHITSALDDGDMYVRMRRIEQRLRDLGKRYVTRPHHTIELLDGVTEEELGDCLDGLEWRMER